MLIIHSQIKNLHVSIIKKIDFFKLNFLLITSMNDNNENMIFRYYSDDFNKIYQSQNYGSFSYFYNDLLIKI